MTAFNIAKAELVQGKARIAIVSPAGGDKTYTALVTAHELGQNILVIDTENGTSAKYAKQLGPFDVMTLPDYSIKTYIDALNFAATKGYDVVIVDSLSHAWAGKGGALEQAEVAKSKHGGNKFAGWGDVTPLQNQLVDTILAYPVHLIATMRMKTEYILTDEGGRQAVKKVGLGIVQRDSFEYEFDIIAQMDIDHNLTITKTRCSDLDGFMMLKPDGTLGQRVALWLGEGKEADKTFTTLDELLYQVNQDFGLDEKSAKDILKTMDYTGFKPGLSTKMYTDIKDSLTATE